MAKPDLRIISSISSDFCIASGFTIASVLSTYICGASIVAFSPVILLLVNLASVA